MADRSGKAYEPFFELDYDGVRVDVNEQNRTNFCFPLRQRRKITRDTPLPQARKNERDCLFVARAAPRSQSREAARPSGTTFKGVRIGTSHSRFVRSFECSID